MKPYKQPFIDGMRREFTEEEKRKFNRSKLEQNIEDHQMILTHARTVVEMVENKLAMMQGQLKRWEE